MKRYNWLQGKYIPLRENMLNTRQWFRPIFLAMLIVTGVLVMLLPVLSCTPSIAPSPDPAPAPAPTPEPTPPPNPAPSSQMTAGQLSEQGKTVFSQFAAACHGPDGEGGRAPAIIGTKAQLVKYNNAGQLLDYITRTMPPNSPGSLSQDQYLQILSYLLVENKFVTPETIIDPNKLEAIQLKQ